MDDTVPLNWSWLDWSVSVDVVDVFQCGFIGDVSDV